MANAECDPSRDIFLTAITIKATAPCASPASTSLPLGPYGAGTHHFAPVCLNSLLYKQKGSRTDRRNSRPGEDAKRWAAAPSNAQSSAEASVGRAERHVRRLQPRYEARSTTTTSRRSIRCGGIATKEQRSPAKESTDLRASGRPGMSDVDRRAVGPAYGWAPTQLIAIEGLRKYGFNEDADRTSYEFLSTSDRTSATRHHPREVQRVTRSSEAKVATGYRSRSRLRLDQRPFLVLLHKFRRHGDAPARTSNPRRLQRLSKKVWRAPPYASGWRRNARSRT